MADAVQEPGWPNRQIDRTTLRVRVHREEIRHRNADFLFRRFEFGLFWLTPANIRETLLSEIVIYINFVGCLKS